MKNKIHLIILLFTLLNSCYGATGDVMHVVSHDREFVITDPSKGENLYPHKALFPNQETDYRKVILHITYECPDSLHCGEWDYIDNVYLRQFDDNGDTLNYEIARVISPYGWWFDSTWSFIWSTDITDFAILLHDSVEIVFRHSGYENNQDRGWLITLDFEITEGTPAMKCFGLDSLYCGSFPYGDSSKPLNELTAPMTFSHDSAKIARLRITQTGHGMDDYENCAEFCKKYRRIYFDSALVDHREIWKKCGDNPLYPQAGTWIFDRANWCPGAVVDPDIYNLDIMPDSTHTIDIDMEYYLNPNKPSANYYIFSYLFYYDAPWAGYDVSIDNILIPNDKNLYSRINPACHQPIILVKNNGKEEINSLVIRFGFDSSYVQIYDWTGNLPSFEQTEIKLPSVISALEEKQEFSVQLESPNGAADQYPSDNKMTSTVVVPPVLNNQFVLSFRTNNDASHNYYSIIDDQGFIVGGRALGSLLPDSLYRDTFDLLSGCYQLLVADTAGDGLKFWFNAEGGYGYVRLLDMDGNLIKNFNSDFGSNINYVFTALEGATNPEPNDSLPLVQVFPTRTSGLFNIYLFSENNIQADIAISHDSTNAVVYEKTHRDLAESVIPIDISSHPEGTYNIVLKTDEREIKRRVRLRH